MPEEIKKKVFERGNIVVEALLRSYTRWLFNRIGPNLSELIGEDPDDDEIEEWVTDYSTELAAKLTERHGDGKAE